MAKEERTFPEKAVIVTDKASFHITISNYKNRDTHSIEHYTVSVGSRKSKCVQINVPSIESGKKQGTLMWVEKIGPICTLTTKDSHSLSQHTVNLAFTIARDINPLCTRYLLSDCSVFDCTLPGERIKNVPMKPFHIAFHGNTWYEKYFGAKLVKNYNIYERLKMNLYNSANKPAEFSFGHEHLNDELNELYASTETWHDFFQVIQTNYGDKKCAVVYPWIIDALLLIFEDNHIFEDSRWYIDLDENAKDTQTPLIPFVSYEDAMTGGRRTTRKRKLREFNVPPVFVRNGMKIQKMNYREFLI